MFGFRRLTMPALGLFFAVSANQALSQISTTAASPFTVQPFIAERFSEPNFVTALADFPDQSSQGSTTTENSPRQGFPCPL